MTSPSALMSMPVVKKFWEGEGLRRKRQFYAKGSA